MRWQYQYQLSQRPEKVWEPKTSWNGSVFYYWSVHDKQCCSVGYQCSLYPLKGCFRLFDPPFINRYMTMDNHVSTSVGLFKTDNYHLRNLSSIRKFIESGACHTAVRALITSRLDYCNSLLNGVSAKTFNRLQLLQTKAARLIYMKPKRTHTSPILSDLHWLRITQCIQFKTLVLTYNALHNESPQYLSDLLHIGLGHLVTHLIWHWTTWPGDSH